MPQRYGTLISTILNFIDLDIPLLPLEDPFSFAKRKRKIKLERKRYLETIWRMQRQGYLKVIDQNGKKFIKITQKGELEKLFQKASVIKPAEWDGKWRVLIFDIPESSHDLRDRFRWLLKKHGFAKLQSSVFISPYALNREALDFLSQTGLGAFIRILRVDDMGNDKELMKRFGVANPRPRIKHT